MRILILLLMIVLSSPAGMAQEKLNPLKAPTSPASSILDLQPKTVLEPKSYRALETALYSNFLNSNAEAVIPTDFALEFTPYWTKNHSLSLEEYLYPKNAWDQLVRNSSFSLASTQNFILGDSTKSNGLAFGYRTTFHISNQKDRDLISNYRTELKTNQRISNLIVGPSELLAASPNVSNKTDFLDQIKATVTKAIYELGGYKTIEDATAVVDKIYEDASLLGELDKNDPGPFLDSFYGVIDKNLHADSLFNKFKDYIRNRQGLSIDVAFASFLNFPTNSFEFSYLPKSAVWVTPTYKFTEKLDFIKILGVLRYEWYLSEYYKRYFPEATIYENNFDYGLSVASEFKRFSIQFELVGRSSNTTIPAGTDGQGNELFRKEKNSDVQYMGTFNYNLTDQIVLTYTLGSRFEPFIDPTETLISLLSLNFGFGTPTMDAIDLSKE